MTVAVTTAATNKELTTLPTIKEELSITSATDDAYLVDLIKQASSAIDTYCNRVFAKQTYLETQVGLGGTEVILSNIPVVTVSSIEFNGTAIDPTTYVIDSAAGILTRGSTWPQFEASFSNIVYHNSGKGYEYLSITYDAGYDTPGSTNLSTLPHDVERACIDLVKFWYDRRGMNPSLKSQKIGESSETLVDMTESGIPKNISAMLSKYVITHNF